MALFETGDRYELTGHRGVFITSNPPPMEKLPPIQVVKINSSNDVWVLTFLVEKKIHEIAQGSFHELV